MLISIGFYGCVLAVFKVQFLCLLQNLEHTVTWLPHQLRSFKHPGVSGLMGLNGSGRKCFKNPRSVGHSDFSPSTLMGRIYSTKGGAHEKNTHLGNSKFNKIIIYQPLTSLNPSAQIPKTSPNPGSTPVFFVTAISSHHASKTRRSKIPAEPTMYPTFPFWKNFLAAKFTQNFPDIESRHETCFPKHRGFIRPNSRVYLNHLCFKGAASITWTSYLLQYMYWPPETPRQSPYFVIFTLGFVNQEDEVHLFLLKLLEFPKLNTKRKVDGVASLKGLSWLAGGFTPSQKS